MPMQAPPKPPIRNSYSRLDDGILAPPPSFIPSSQSETSSRLAMSVGGGGPILIPSAFDEDLGRVVPTLIIHTTDLIKSPEECRAIYHRRK